MGVVVRATVATGVVGEVFHVLHRPRVFNVRRGVVLLRSCGCTRRARSSNGRCRRRNGTFHVRHSRARRSWIQRGVDAATNVAAAHSRRSGRARCAAGNLASRLQTCASLFAFGSPRLPHPTRPHYTALSEHREHGAQTRARHPLDPWRRQRQPLHCRRLGCGDWGPGAPKRCRMAAGT